MKRLLILGSVLVLRAAPAMAADLAYKAPAYAPAAAMVYNWTGLYVGLNAGGGWDHNCWSTDGALGFGFSPAIAEGCPTASGAIVGGQVGYRYQFSSFVIGIEGQGDWADLTGSNTSTVFNGVVFPKGVSASLINSSKVDAIGLFTGQVGYVIMPQLLLYLKGGAAVTDNKYDGSFNLSAGRGFTLSATDHADQVKFGGVVGAGAEYAVYGGFTVGVEYNHLFMGSSNTGFALTSLSTTPAFVLPKNVFAPGMPTRNDSISQDIDMVAVRLNYKFTSQ
jgi:outer membrane immunogenic protein